MSLDTKNWYKALISEHDRVIPTIAFYHPNCINVMNEALASNDYSLRHVYVSNI
jgi:molybdopterin-guanine dinucleotide biosynthesis protein A